MLLKLFAKGPKYFIVSTLWPQADNYYTIMIKDVYIAVFPSHQDAVTFAHTECKTVQGEKYCHINTQTRGDCETVYTDHFEQWWVIMSANVVMPNLRVVYDIAQAIKNKSHQFKETGS